jgi:hypothetical protein
MAKRRISITIDAEDKTCGACEHVTHIDDPMSPEGFCVLFGAVLDLRGGEAVRCSECLERDEGRLE